MIEPIPSLQFTVQDDLPTAHAEPAPAAGTDALPFAAPPRYRVRQEIGRGFSSIVYEAIDTLRGRPVALKVLTLGHTLSRERRQDMEERFLREARAISALSHPNIVSVHEVGQTDGEHHFMAMELLAGESLRARMDRDAPLAPDTAVPIALQIADALQYAHSRGIVHRDVKPDNIYVLPDGRVKLMDFGVAHILSEGALTQTGTVVGSPAYMSPEQISGLALGGGSDVFSLGITLAEMLTGEKPFDAPSIPAVMNKILHRPPKIDSVQPRALRRVVAQALAKSQSARFLTAGAFAEALRRQMRPALSGATVSDTVIMDTPLAPSTPASNAARFAATGSHASQEPPSRATLWTFGVAASLLLLVGVPLTFGHFLPGTASGARVGATASSGQNKVVRLPSLWHHQPAPRRVTRFLPTPPAAPRPVPAVQVVALPTKPIVPAALPAPQAKAETMPAALRPQKAVVAATPVPALAKPQPAPVRVANSVPPARAAVPRPHPQVAALPHPHPQVAAVPHPPQAIPHTVTPRPVVRVADARQERNLPPAPVSEEQIPPSAAAPSQPLFLVPNGPPHVLRRAAATYPSNLRAGGIGGTVLVRVSVNAQGQVTEATVIQSSGTDDLDAAALDAIGRWFYEPAYQNGRAVPAQATARFVFQP